MTKTNVTSSKIIEKRLGHGETPRLLIRPYSDSDFLSSVELYGNPILTKFFDHGEPRTVEEVQEYLEERAVRYQKNEGHFGIFSVFLKKDERFIGQVDLVPTESPGEVEIGWIFLQDYHGCGYCSEAVIDFLVPLINELVAKGIKANGTTINTVMATAHPDNLPSNKMIVKAGLRLYKRTKRYGGKPRNWYRLGLGENS